MLHLTPHNKTYISPPLLFFFFTFIHFYLINLTMYISNFNIIIISQLLHKTRNCVIKLEKERKKEKNPHTLWSPLFPCTNIFPNLSLHAHPMNLEIKFQFHSQCYARGYRTRLSSSWSLKDVIVFGMLFVCLVLPFKLIYVKYPCINWCNVEFTKHFDV